MDKRKGPMARADRRRQLLDVAGTLITRDGLGALTMTALSEHGYVEKPFVYSPFANRDQVAIALLDEYFTDVQQFARAYRQGLDPR